MSDNLDEFFDFAQLEHDSRVHDQLSHVDHDQVAFAGSVTAMDWQPVVPNFTTVHSEHQGPDMQWPLDEMLAQSLVHDNSNTAPFMWPVSDVPVLDNHQQCLDPTPSMSLPSHDHTSLVTDEQSPHVFSQANEVIISPHGPVGNNANERPSMQMMGRDKVISSSTAKPSVPKRHASSASWKPASAKRKGPQSRIPLESRQILEDEFATNPYPCSWEYDIIAHQANLDVKKVRNWFNNTRARKKGEGNS